jgi:hypothetical protein
LFESNTLIELNCASRGSLKKISTCTGGCCNTAFAAGLERTNKAWADADETAHKLNTITTINGQNKRFFIATKDQF